MKTLRGIFLQAVPHDPFQAGRNVAPRFRKLGRLFFQNRAHRVGRGLTVEGPLAGNHLVENRPEGKNV